MRLIQAYRNLFADKKYFRLFLPVAVPIALQSLVSSLTSLGSGVLVGQLGDDAIAGVSLAGQIQFVMILSTFGIGSGAAIFASQFWGKGDHGGVARTQGVSLVLSTAVGLLFAVGAGVFPETLLRLFTPDAGVIAEGARYLHASAWSFPLTAVGASYSLVLRAIGDTKTPLLFAGAGLVVQLILAVGLIFGVGMTPLGVEGAGIALVAAKLVETGGIIIRTQLKKRANAGFRRLLSFDAAFFGHYLKVALPLLVSELLWSVGLSGVKAIYGWMGATELASVAILDTFNQLVFVVFFGSGNAAGMLIGHAIGRGHLDEARRFGRNTLLLAPVVGAAVAVLVAVAAPFVPLIFHVTPAVRELTTSLLWVFCLLLPGKSFYHDTLVGVLRGGGDTVFSLFVDQSGIWLWALPLGWLMAFVFHWPFLVVYFLIGLEEPLKSSSVLWRMKSGRWIHEVTKT
jgi:putative MATE family efflux protein